ncbi:MAG: DUF2700 domain-containing protein [Flavobacteriales bacterium]|nr:DUF2700 domain-containing protein [Flavobacteriales bacterium]MCC6936716.1 DUF2700 domain-containing protein [Flavobacteriales bacterium]
MPTFLEHIKLTINWSVVVPLPPEVLAGRLSNWVEVGDPDSVSWSEGRNAHGKDLVGKVDATGFRLRERSYKLDSNRSRPVAYGLFTPERSGTLIECRIRSGNWLHFVLIFLAINFCVLVVVLVASDPTLSTTEAIVILPAALLIVLALFSIPIWMMRSAASGLKDLIDTAFRKSIHSHGRREPRGRRR